MRFDFLAWGGFIAIEGCRREHREDKPVSGLLFISYLQVITLSALDSGARSGLGGAEME